MKINYLTFFILFILATNSEDAALISGWPTVKNGSITQRRSIPDTGEFAENK